MRIRIQKYNSHIQFWSLFALLILLVFVRYVLQVNFPWEILLGIVTGMAFLGDRNEILALCACCIPLCTSLQYIYAAIICLAIYVLKYYREIRVNGCFLMFLTLLVWELLHCFDEYSSIMGMVRAMSPLMLCTLQTGLPQNQKRYPFVIRVFSICVIAMCLIMLSKILIRSDFSVPRMFSSMKRLGLANSEENVIGADLNPNFLGFLCILGSTGLLQLRLNREKQKHDLLMILLLIGFGILTMSRTFLLCLGFMICLFVLVGGFNIKKLLKFGGIAISACLLIFLFVLVFLPDTLNLWIERFLVEDISSGRFLLMEIYHDRIFSNPDIYGFGIGIQSVTAKVIHRFGSRKVLGTVVPHNAIQELVFCWGIPGALLFVAYVYGMIRNARNKNRQIAYINYIPFILFFIKIQAGQLVAMPQNLLTIMIPYLSLCHCFDNENIGVVSERIKYRIDRRKNNNGKLRKTL